MINNALQQKYKYFLLADIGGTTISTLIVDNQNNRLTKVLKRSTKRNLRKIKLLGNIIDAFQSTIRKSAIKETKSIRLLVALPTRLNEMGNIISCPNLPTLGDTNFKKEIENRLNMPLFISSDSYCFIAGEFTTGCAKGFKHFCGITLGTGVGLAFFINGEPFFGAHGFAGEIWKSAYKDGIWEDYVSSKYIQSVYQKNSGKFLTVKEIAKRAFGGEKNAKEVFVKFGIHLAYGLSYIINILDPEVIVFGGSISKSYELFKESTIHRIKKYLVNHKKIIIKASVEPDLSPLLGIKWLYEHRNKAAILHK